jgi:hypothetical protein
LIYAKHCEQFGDEWPNRFLVHAPTVEIKHRGEHSASYSTARIFHVTHRKNSAIQTDKNALVHVVALYIAKAVWWQPTIEEDATVLAVVQEHVKCLTT